MRKIRKSTSKSSFQFENLQRIDKSGISPEEAIDIARRKSESAEYQDLGDVRITETGVIDGSSRKFSPYGFGRLCSALSIPRRFIEKLSTESAPLAAQVVNDQISRHSSGLQLVYDAGIVAGVVSNRYTRLTNHDVMEMSAEASKGLRLHRFRLEGLRMRVNLTGDTEKVKSRFIPPEERGDYKVGDIVDDLARGLDILNSEDGGTAYSVSAYVLRLVCSNGLVAPKTENLGRVLHRGSAVRERAMVIMDAARDRTNSIMQDMASASAVTVDEDAQALITDNIRKSLSLGIANRAIEQAQREAVEEGHGDVLTLYNVVNGLTAQAHNEISLERARNVEVVASQLMTSQLSRAA